MYHLVLWVSRHEKVGAGGKQRSADSKDYIKVVKTFHVPRDYRTGQLEKQNSLLEVIQSNPAEPTRIAA